MRYPERLINIKLKLFTFATKTLTTFYLASILKEDAFGKFGLINAIVIYYIYIAGAELYINSNRELISAQDNKRSEIITNAGLFYSITSLIGLSVTPVVLYFLDPSISAVELMIITLIIISEHLLLEIYRCLIALEKQIQASLTNAFRISWIYVIVLMHLTGIQVTFDRLLISWLAFNAVGIVLSFSILRNSLDLRIDFRYVDFNWISNIFRKSIPYFFSSISLGGLSAIDRILINHDYGILPVAGYVFYMSIANAMYSLVEAAIYVYAYPKLISKWKNGDLQSFYQTYRSMWIESTLAVILMVFIGYELLPYVLHAMDKQTYRDCDYLYWPISLLVAAKVANSNFQYLLYAKKCDKSIYINNILITPIFLAIYLLLKNTMHLQAIVYSLIAAYTINAVLKAYFGESPEAMTR